MFKTNNSWKDTHCEKQLAECLFGKVNAFNTKSKKNFVYKSQKFSQLQENKSLHGTKKKVKTSKTDASVLKLDIKNDQKNIDEMKKYIPKRKLVEATNKLLVDCKKTKISVENRSNVPSSKPLKTKLLEKLESSRFRYINEQMYTNDSKSTVKMFNSDLDAFSIYHRGYKAQVEKWPSNPLDHIISWIKLRPKKLILADFGCGDAAIAQSVKNKVHSFDLCAVNKFVTVADMSKVPLDDESVDVVIFCLSLMGTNLKEFLFEANRVLKDKGYLKIAEVASRFRDVPPFIRAMRQFGFHILKKDLSNTHFFIFDFQKIRKLEKNALEKSSLKEIELKPCLYKKR